MSARFSICGNGASTASSAAVNTMIGIESKLRCALISSVESIVDDAAFSDRSAAESVGRFYCSRVACLSPHAAALCFAHCVFMIVAIVGGAT